MQFTLKLVLLHLTIVAAEFEFAANDAEVVRAPPPPPSKTTIEMGSCLFPLVRGANRTTLAKYTSAYQGGLTTGLCRMSMFYEGIIGRVVVDENCECDDGTELIPAYMMYDKAADYMLVTDPELIDSLKAKGYVQKQLDFYCSPQLNKCGATKTLYEHVSIPPANLYHYYTTNSEKSKQLTAAKNTKTGQPCYIWDNGNQATVV